MDVNALRTWGMTVSAAAMAGALAIALLSREAPQAAAPSAAQTQDEAAGLSFLVRFQGEGPIARAARAGDARAEQAIAAQLERQIDLAGLCFAGFGGRAEIILRTCNAISADDRESLEQRWLQRLRSMRGVAYASVETAPLARTPD